MRPHLRPLFALAAFAGIALVLVSATDAQPGGKKGAESVDDFVAKLMAFNKAKDGKLTKTELTDQRLHDLFERADTKKNGYVTRPDLEALYARESFTGGPGDKGKAKKKNPL